MVMTGNGDESHKIENSVTMEPGLGLLEDCVVEIGLDENTAIVVEKGATD